MIGGALAAATSAPRSRLRDVAFTSYGYKGPRVTSYWYRKQPAGLRLTRQGVEQLARTALAGSARLQLHLSAIALDSSSSSAAAAAATTASAGAAQVGQQQPQNDLILGYAEPAWGQAVLAALPADMRRSVRIAEKPLLREDLFPVGGAAAGAGEGF